MEIKAGMFCTVCGGARAVVIAATKQKVLLLRTGKSHNTFIVGHDPIVFQDEVQWVWGRYFDCFAGNDEEMLAKAVDAYQNLLK